MGTSPFLDTLTPFAAQMKRVELEERKISRFVSRLVFIRKSTNSVSGKFRQQRWINFALCKTRLEVSLWTEGISERGNCVLEIWGTEESFRKLFSSIARAILASSQLALKRRFPRRGDCVNNRTIDWDWSRIFLEIAFPARFGWTWECAD